MTLNAACSLSARTRVQGKQRQAALSVILNIGVRRSDDPSRALEPRYDRADQRGASTRRTHAALGPHGKPRVRLRIRLLDRTLVAHIAAKSLRKAQAAIRKAGADNVVLMLQGCLVGDTIAEAGLPA